jgi:hypothetical protein
MELELPAFVEVEPGVFKSASDGVIRHVDGHPLLTLGGKSYRLRRRFTELSELTAWAPIEEPTKGGG